MKKNLIFLLVISILLITGCSKENSLFKKAEYLTKKGQYSKARTLYTEVIKINPKSYLAYNNRGIINERLGKKDLAQKDYIKAITLNSSFPEVYSNLGALYIDEDKYYTALEYLNRAVILDENYYTARVNRAIASFNLGNASSALKDINKATELMPYHPL
ncbi:MAG: tetratricopeptide repeat protein, partial [Elusimicrobiaceae bacterium]|nr:tetratricopeptide repeat protein [Elusimicrobiaceae bacterium]